MTATPEREPLHAWTAETLFVGDDDTARAHRTADWSSTPLGPVETWSPELVAAVATVFASDVAMLLWLGPDLVQVFNHAYRSVLGNKYPKAVGQPGAECWPDVWTEMGPLADDALAGHTTRGTEVRLLMDRRGGVPEETYWTFSYSPIRAVGGSVVGVFVATSEVTGTVLGRRRMGALQQLGSIPATRGDHPVSTCRAAVEMLTTYSEDFPLVLVYVDPVATFDTSREHRLGSADNVVVGPDGRGFELVAVGKCTSPDEAHRWLALGRGLAAIESVVGRGTAEHVDGLSGAGIGPAVADLPLDEVTVLPLRIAGQSAPVGALVVGSSPFQVVDDEHRSFLDITAGRISTMLTDVLAYEFERQRGTALSALDDAKTTFLENVSHEFKTPLTMLLGPLEELRHETRGTHRESVDVALRNASRLQELVDSLLDVAGAAGSIRVHLEPTDIVELTRHCVDRFRGAVDESGVTLDMTAEGLTAHSISIDRENWNRIVSNLVANAVNYTHRGSVRVSLRQKGSDVVLSVTDTGIGIAPADQGRVFDRFYRVGDARGLSAEGSGIGLALVSELATAMGGTASVESALGEGSTFTVVVPAVPADTGAAPSTPVTDTVTAGLDGAATALPMTRAVAAGPVARHIAAGPVARHVGVRGGGERSVLLVEDNADMRDYLVRLLTTQDWDVYASADVESALRHARSTRPGLVLTDVMLPGRSGLDLVQELRSDPSLVRVPVIVLTARSGTGSAVQGLEAGADDYVTKPFDARELLARIRVHLELSAIREELLEASNNEAMTLQEALVTRSTIGTAIGLLMAAEGVDARAAFARLTKISQNSNRKAKDVAAEMVDNFSR